MSTQDRRQSKMLLTIDKCESKIARNCVFDCHLGDKKQSTNGNKKLCF